MNSTRISLALCCLLAVGCGEPDDGNSLSGTSLTTASSVANEDESDTGMCVDGSPGCACYPNATCDAGLQCAEGVCTSAGDGDGDPTDGDGDGDGDGDPGDGDGDPGDGDGESGDGDGDGDGDPTGNEGDGDGDACQGDQSFMIDAVDADTIEGWDPVMSMLGEGTVLAWDNASPDAFVEFDLDIPCAADWHIWVRAIDSQDLDSLYAEVDGGPMPTPVFEIDCAPGPPRATYKWRELNWRDPNELSCEYVEDPWVQTWAAGLHTLLLTYRECYSISKVWLTNTDLPPP